MRFPALLLICTALFAQRPEDVVKQLERAEQTGDGEAYFALWSAKSDMAAHPEIKTMGRARPSVRYTISKIVVDGDRAAAALAYNDSFVSMTLVLENGAWKILDQRFSNVPIDPAALYASIPPPDGAFARAGLPWDRIAAAPGTTKWKLRAVSDESYVYVRIETQNPLPPPGTEVKGEFPNLPNPVDRVWPNMKIRAAGSEFSLHADDSIGDHATFDKSGKANSHRHSVIYSLTLWRGDHVAFDSSVEPLISVHDRFIDLRIPLKSIGAEPRAKITIADANVPGQFAA